MKLPTALIAALEAAFNQYLRLDPEGPARLADLAGKVIAVELAGLDVTLYFIPGPGGVQVMGHYEGEPDTTLSGTPLALARLSAAGGAPDGLFAGEVKIAGDVELGGRFQRVLRALDIDWEEHLSHLVGDVAAYQMGRAVRGGATWLRRIADTLGQDLAEYLHEETRELPPAPEVDAFLADVDELRLTADRLEARVKRLHNALAGNKT